MNKLKDPAKVKRDTIEDYWTRLVKIVSVEEQHQGIEILDEFIDIDLLWQDAGNEKEYHEFKIEDLINNHTNDKKSKCQETIEKQHSWLINSIMSYCSVYLFNSKNIIRFSWKAEPNTDINMEIKADRKVEIDFRTSLFDNFKKIVTLLKGLSNLLKVEKEVKKNDDN